MIASAQGGVNIEDIAEANPDAILKFPINIRDGMTRDKALEIAQKLEIPSGDHDMVAETLQKLYNLFINKDATMVEINPFAEAADGGCELIILILFPYFSKNSDKLVAKHGQLYFRLPAIFDEAESFSRFMAV